MSRRFLTAVLMASVMTSITLGTQAQAQNQRNVNPNVFGATYGEWAAQWWRWAFGAPADQNPVQDLTGEFCDVNQPNGKVWFLAGSFGVTDVVRNCTVPKNRALFYPLVNSIWIDCPGTADETTPDAAVRAILAQLTVAGDLACQLRSYLDGEPLDVPQYGTVLTNPISGLQTLTVRTQSPKFTVTLPENHIAVGFCSPDLQPGETGRAIAEGYWVMLPPLSPGEHTLTLHGAGCVFDEDGNGSVLFETGVTYHLNVQ